jgi:hypothetical protein
MTQLFACIVGSSFIRGRAAVGKTNLRAGMAAGSWPAAWIYPKSHAKIRRPRHAAAFPSIAITQFQNSPGRMDEKTAGSDSGGFS